MRARLPVLAGVVVCCLLVVAIADHVGAYDDEATHNDVGTVEEAEGHARVLQAPAGGMKSITRTTTLTRSGSRVRAAAPPFPY